MNVIKKVALCIISVFMVVSVSANAAITQPVSASDKALILNLYSLDASATAKEHFVKKALQWCQAKNYASVEECTQAMRSKIQEAKLNKKSESSNSTSEFCIPCPFSTGSGCLMSQTCD